jgi:KaiC/GvpD/RAD55 family RecA-like ATPase
MAIQRVPLGIKGLDDMLKGGIPRNHHVVITGGPGTGKTSFCMQYLWMGITQFDEWGVFITLEEKPEKIIGDVKAAFGWDLDYEIKKGRLSIIAPDKYNFQNLMDLIQAEVLQQGMKRIVIDPLTMLRLFFKDDFDFRKNLFNMLDFLGSMDCTVLLTAERPYAQRENMEFQLEEFITDGVIALYNIPRKNERIRALEILKMRGTSHSSNVYPFQITDKGIVVVPEEIF